MYSHRIYQLMMQYKSTGYVKISLDKLRFMLVLNGKYKFTKDLRKRVIDVAINEINEKTPYNVTYELTKTGRKFTYLEMTFKRKKEEKTVTHDRDKDTIDWVSGLSDKQINYFGNLLANDDKFNSKTFPAPIGLEMNSYEQLVKQNLRNPDYQKQWSLDLKRLGLKK